MVKLKRLPPREHHPMSDGVRVARLFKSRRYSFKPFIATGSPSAYDRRMRYAYGVAGVSMRTILTAEGDYHIKW